MRISINPQFVIGQPPQSGRSIATDLLGGTPGEVGPYCWEETQRQVVTLTLVQVPRDVSAVREFCDRVSELGAAAVMVEELDADDLQHVTTFLYERSQELESRIYQIEAEIIQKYSKANLEFHVRIVPRDSDGIAVLPSGSYYLLTWRAA
jgi:hypothetical protein